MVIERLFLKKLLDKNKFKLLNRIYTLFVVLISWVLFRTTSLDGAFEFIKTMFIQNINVLLKKELPVLEIILPIVTGRVHTKTFIAILQFLHLQAIMII